MSRHPNHPPHRVLRAASLLLLAAALGAQATTQLQYTVDAKGSSIAEREFGLDLKVVVTAPPGESTVFEIPVWTPGSYRLRDFPERITPLGARAGNTELQVATISASAFEVRHGAVPEVEFRYRVTLRTGDRFLHASKNRRCITYEGPAVYVYVRRLLDKPCSVRFELPEGWSQASGLQPADNGAFVAKDYDQLADCMVKLGKFQSFSYESLGTKFHAIVDDEKDLQIDAKPWLDGLRAITEEGAAVFGGKYPYTDYWFLFTVGQIGDGGGLEHLNSTGIGLSRAAFVNNPASSFGICAHEFFHCWNVKRLRPIELGPFHYDRPNRTTGLWLSEGVTSYYAEVLRARAGQMTDEQFWQAAARQISSFEGTPGRRFTSSAKASFSVWDRMPNDRRVDYYGSGEVLGLLLDLQIRAATGGKQGLDHAMHAMLEQCQAQGRGLTEAEIEGACSKAAGKDLGSFFARCVSGTSVPDYAAILGAAGIDVAVDDRRETVLRGLDRSRKDAPVFTDFRAMESSGGGDPAPLSGRVRSIDGKPVANGEDAGAAVAAAIAAGKTSVAVDYERSNGVTATANAALEERNRPRYRLTLQADPGPEKLAVRQGITASRRAK